LSSSVASNTKILCTNLSSLISSMCFRTFSYFSHSFRPPFSKKN
jgi:hypothetical protein